MPTHTESQENEKEYLLHREYRHEQIKPSLKTSYSLMLLQPRRMFMIHTLCFSYEVSLCFFFKNNPGALDVTMMGYSKNLI